MKLPTTKQECFQKLESLLSEEDLNKIKSDPFSNDIDYHFSLGLWIRNNWLYKHREHFEKIFSTTPEEDGFVMPQMADDKSAEIIDEFLDYLVEK